MSHCKRKTKYVTETAKVIKKMIKSKQLEKNSVDDGMELLGGFKTYCNTSGLHLCSNFRNNKSASAKTNICSSRNIGKLLGWEPFDIHLNKFYLVSICRGGNSALIKSHLSKKKIKKC